MGRGSSIGWRPSRCGGVSTRGSSRSARGFPPVNSTSALAVSGERSRSAETTRRSASSSVRPASVIEASPSRTTLVGSVVRVAQSAAMPSFPSRRHANASAAAEPLIEPVRVVDQEEQRCALRCEREQAERAGVHGVGIRVARLERQCAANRRCLSLREAREVVEDGPQGLEQAGERELGLGLESPRAEDPHSVSGRCSMFEERRLAHARLAADDEGPALAAARGGKQVVDRPLLVVPPDEHARIVGRRRAAKCPRVYPTRRTRSALTSRSFSTRPPG